MTMTKKYKILGKYIKDMSSETPDIETYIFVRDYISKYDFFLLFVLSSNFRVVFTSIILSFSGFDVISILS